MCNPWLAGVSCVFFWWPGAGWPRLMWVCSVQCKTSVSWAGPGQPAAGAQPARPGWPRLGRQTPLGRAESGHSVSRARTDNTLSHSDWHQHRSPGARVRLRHQCQCMSPPERPGESQHLRSWSFWRIVVHLLALTLTPSRGEHQTENWRFWRRQFRGHQEARQLRGDSECQVSFDPLWPSCDPSKLSECILKTSRQPSSDWYWFQYRTGLHFLETTQFSSIFLEARPRPEATKICWHFSPVTKLKWIHKNVLAGTLGWPDRIRKMTIFLWDWPEDCDDRYLQILWSSSAHIRHLTSAETGRCARDQTQTSSMEASAWRPTPSPRSRWWGTTTTTTTSSAATAAPRPTAPVWTAHAESGKICYNMKCKAQIFSTFPIYLVIHEARVKSIKSEVEHTLSK